MKGGSEIGNWAGKKILITGGAGFIGSHLTEELLNKGADVTIVDISGDNKNRNLKGVISDIDFIKCDVSIDKEVRKLSNKDFEYIFHLAAIASTPMCENNPETAFKTNVHGTYNILKLATDMKNLKKILFTSSALVYGKTPKYLPIDEKHPVEFAESIYNITKGIGEMMFESFNKKYDLPVLIFRFFNMFGPRQTEDYFIPTVISQALKKGTVEIWNAKPSRDFTFITDTISALMRGAQSDFIGGPINIGSGVEISTGDMAQYIAKKLGAKVKFLNLGVAGSVRLCCDNTLAKKILQWEPTVSFEEGVKKTIEWWKTTAKIYLK